MKFTQDQAVSKLTEVFADKAKGIDLGRTISEAVSNGIEMIGDTSEMELDAFTAIVEKNVSSALGLARHLKNSATTELQQQIAELKAKGSNPPAPPKEDKPDIYQTLQAQLDELKSQRAKDEAEKAIAEKRTLLKTKMGESIKDNEWIEGFLAEVTVDEKFDVEAKAKDYVAFYNKTHTRSGKVTTKPAGNSSDDDNNYVSNTVKEAAKIAAQRRKMGAVTTTVQQ